MTEGVNIVEELCDCRKSSQSLPKANDVRADAERLTGYLSMMLELIEKEPAEKRIIRQAEITQIKRLCDRLQKHFG
jgi:hypothetical protein